MRFRKVCANRDCEETSDVCEWREVHSLGVPLGIDKITFQQLWDKYMQPGWVESQLACCCPRTPCGHSVRTFLEREPPLLYVRLDRVHTDGEKSHAAVDFPRYLRQRSGLYECAGIIHHEGETCNSGHYTAICRTSARGGYRHFDDAGVSDKSLSWNEVTRIKWQRTAHSLLYVRVDLSDAARADSQSTLPYAVGAESQLRLP